MTMAFGSLIILFGIIIAAALMVMIFMYVLIPVLKGIGFLFGHVGRFIGGMFRDVFRLIGAVPAMIVFAMLSVLNTVIGRWSAASHFGAHVQNEIKTMGGCLYRVGIGHPLRLVGFGSMLEGIEHRVPAVMAESPGRDRPGRRVGQFDGYTIVGSLPGGGSGGRLYVAEPSKAKRERITKSRGSCPERVVIKAFAVADGSSLPQIVRESRSLEGAKQIGLILEHELTDDRFFYVMPYVAGEHLGSVVRQMHSQSGDRGLSDACLRDALVFMADVASTLKQYHSGGLWHKDIKPENIVVNQNGAHIVDLGLVTSLRSAMTLTTHGTEYFRDPEMVRMALRGVKVHEVDGAKFDIYGAGAVLYYVLENTFPSHGGLSTITRRCPDAVKWIVRRAMTDYNQRYASASLLLADIQAVLAHQDVWSMKPAELPSMRSGAAAMARDEAEDADPRPMDPTVAIHGSAGSSEKTRSSEKAYSSAPSRGGWRETTPPRFTLVNWWTGRIAPGRATQQGPRDLKEDLIAAKDEVRTAVHEARDRIKTKVRAWKSGDEIDAVHAVDINNATTEPAIRFGAVGPKRPASEQLASARNRANRRRRRAQAWRSDTLNGKRRKHAAHRPIRHSSERINVGMIIAAIGVVGVLVVTAGGVSLLRAGSRQARVDYGSHGAHVVADPGAVSAPISLDKPVPEIVNDQTVESIIMSGIVEDLPRQFLIINDHPELRSKELRDRVAQISTALTAIGLQPVEEVDVATSMDARVRTAVSRVSTFDLAAGDYLDAEEAVGSLLGVDDQLADLGVVVWLAKGDHPGNRVITWVLTPDCATSDIDDKILGYLSAQQ